MPSLQIPYIAGIAVVGAATLLLALGRTVVTLLIARLLQGFSSAIVFTVGCAILLDAVGQENIGQAMGYTGVGLTLGVLLGPIIGGLLYQSGGYFHVFIPAFVLIGMEILLRLMVITEKSTTAGTPSEAPSEPILGYENSSLATYGTADMDIDCPNRSPKRVDETTIEDRSASDNSVLESKSKAPERTRTAVLVLLRSPRFWVAIGALGTLNSFTGAFDAVLPTYARDSLDLDAMQIALLFLTMSLPSLLSPLSGALADRYGSKWPAAGALILMTASLISLRLVQHADQLAITTLVILLSTFGIEFTLAMNPLMAEISAAVDDIEKRKPGVFGNRLPYTQAYGVMNASFAAGSMVGPLVSHCCRPPVVAI